MIAIGCDHGGFELKKVVTAHLEAQGIPYQDFGTHSTDSCDYPVYAKAVGEAVASGTCQKGIVICGTGIGISIAANKIAGIRCALCTDPYCAEMTRRHNDANVLAMGARVVGPGLALSIVDAFLKHEFEAARHRPRVDMISALEG